MASIGSLVGFLRLDDSQYQRVLRQSQARTRAFVRGMSSAFTRFLAPAVLLGGVATAVRGALRLGEEIKNLSAQSGLAIDEFQALEFVFRQNGATGEQAANAVNRFRLRLADAVEGSADARRDFAQLGLDWRALARLPLAAAFEQVAQASSTMSEDLLASGAAADILGTRDAPKLRAALRDLARNGFGELSKQAQAAGQALSEESVQRLEEAQQAIENLKRSIVTFAGERIATLQLLASGELESLNEAEKAFERLAKARERVATPPPANVVQRLFGVDPAEIARMKFEFALKEFARAVANEEGRLTGTLVTLAQKALRELEAIQEQRGQLTAETIATHRALEEQLAAQRVRLEQQAADAATTAGEERVAAEKASADQRLSVVRAFFQQMDEEGQAELDRHLRERASSLGRELSLPWEEYQRAITEVELLLQRGLISQEQFNRAVRAARDELESTRFARTALEQLHETLRQLDEAAQDGQISQEAYTRAVEDAEDAARAVKDPFEEYAAELRKLDRLQRDGLISGRALALAIRDAASAAGSFQVGEVERLIGIGQAAGGSRARSAGRAQVSLERARASAARGNFRAARFHFDQAQRRSGGAAGTGQTLEEFLGGLGGAGGAAGGGGGGASGAEAGQLPPVVQALVTRLDKLVAPMEVAAQKLQLG